MRRCKNWLQDFIKYASIGEAPIKMYFWTGVSTIAGALRRKVWIDQKIFTWTPNFYIIFVAPPGIISKTTTINVGMDLLREVSGIKFGPDIVTWQKLVEDIAAAAETVIDPKTGESFIMSSLTIAAGEFGTLVSTTDREMIDILVALWDGQRGTLRKATKSSGSDTIKNPWFNIIACTTPTWITENFPEYMIGGGFVSRCVFIYADKKRQLSAYPADQVTSEYPKLRADLIADLEEISQLVGEVTLDAEAKAWGIKWYENHWNSGHFNLPPEQFGGYLARKQTHIHKLAMVISAAYSDSLVLSMNDLQMASDMIDALEYDMPKVFSQIGRTQSTQALSTLLEIVFARGAVSKESLFRSLSRKCTWQEFTQVLTSATQAGFVSVENRDGTIFIVQGKK